MGHWGRRGGAQETWLNRSVLKVGLPWRLGWKETFSPRREGVSFAAEKMVK